MAWVLGTDLPAMTNLTQVQADSISPPATWALLAPMTSQGHCCRVPIGSHASMPSPEMHGSQESVNKPVPLTPRDGPETHFARLFWGADLWI